MVILCAKLIESVIEINVTFFCLAEFYVIYAANQLNPVLIAFLLCISDSIISFCVDIQNFSVLNPSRHKVFIPK